MPQGQKKVTQPLRILELARAITATSLIPDDLQYVSAGTEGPQLIALTSMPVHCFKDHRVQDCPQLKGKDKQARGSQAEGGSNEEPSRKRF